tara:strand:- start:174 stop:422 length:249 start_codon:yes stop_codon:yes gene_type:complete
MNINQEIEKEEMKVQNLVKDWHSQKLVSFIDDLIKKDRAEQLILSGVSSSLPNESELTAEQETRKEKFEHDLRWEENRGNEF